MYPEPAGIRVTTNTTTTMKMPPNFNSDNEIMAAGFSISIAVVVRLLRFAF